MEEQVAKVIDIAFSVNKKSIKLNFDAFFRMANSLLLNFLSHTKKVTTLAAINLATTANCNGNSKTE